MNDPLSSYDRTVWAGRFADKRVYTDDKLRAMLETAREEMAELIRAELERRAAES